MPLGNLTSQFFANVYLNELDYFVKHNLKAKYYIRYVDDFVILHESHEQLQKWKLEINNFLETSLNLELHKGKSKISNLDNGISFLGFRIFFYHKLVRKSNLRKFERKFRELRKLYEKGRINREKVVEFLEGWLNYVSYGDTFKLRKSVIRVFNKSFPSNTSRKIRKHRKFFKNVEYNKLEFSVQKTLFLYRKKLSVKEIAIQREIKESTVWTHLAALIEHRQLSVWRIMPKQKIFKIVSKIRSRNDLLKEIKERLNDNEANFDEIACVLAWVKNRGGEPKTIS